MLEWTDEIDFVCLSNTYGVLSFHRSTQFRKLSLAVVSELSWSRRKRKKEREKSNENLCLSASKRVNASAGNPILIKENFLWLCNFCVYLKHSDVWRQTKSRFVARMRLMAQSWIIEIFPYFFQVVSFERQRGAWWLGVCRVILRFLLHPFVF